MIWIAILLHVRYPIECTEVSGYDGYTKQAPIYCAYKLLMSVHDVGARELLANFSCLCDRLSIPLAVSISHPFSRAQLRSEHCTDRGLHSHRPSLRHSLLTGRFCQYRRSTFATTMIRFVMRRLIKEAAPKVHIEFPSIIMGRIR